MNNHGSSSKSNYQMRHRTQGHSLFVFWCRLLQLNVWSRGLEFDKQSCLVTSMLGMSEPNNKSLQPNKQRPKRSSTWQLLIMLEKAGSHRCLKRVHTLTQFSPLIPQIGWRFGGISLVMDSGTLYLRLMSLKNVINMVCINCLRSVLRASLQGPASCSMCMTKESGNTRNLKPRSDIS